MSKLPKQWNEMGFWEYKCGCIQYQDGWDKCSACIKALREENWEDEEMDVNPAETPERRAAAQRGFGTRGYKEIDTLQKEVIQPLQKDEHFQVPIRKFDSGATRSNNEGKLDYFRFNHPLVEKVWAEYMHKHRKQENGELRDGNNWWKGWSKETSAESLIRHIKDIELHLAGYPHEATETLEDSICASIFNLKALLLQVLKEKGRANGTN